MAQKTGKPKPQVSIRACWGNDDAESTIKVSPGRWKSIQEGAQYERNAWGWYEGSRFSVTWKFADGLVSIDGPDGMQCLNQDPLCELVVEDAPPSAQSTLGSL